MGIALSTSVPPQALRAFTLGACALGLIATWDVVQKKVQELAFQPVYGEQTHATAVAVRDELYSLPIVMAKSDVPVEEGSAISDAAIEAAFRKPIVEIDDDEPEPVKVSLAHQLIMQYRPYVNGLSTNGAIVNGQFWSVGEPMATMPMRNAMGQIVTPKIESIISGRVVLSIADEALTLTFNER
ncbi:hypothetical protein [Stutzerimonas stutzeri]|uniref:hypothetical protein n=1 Tax=Stutzerimonas stutzeri TaxID=316 RepID=UPI0015E481B3|nr:hypothetical protein [Stutzerimonas stutzeri]MBA1280201.1 hypothetical protein [Stutzerimonas stutzeri]